MRRIIIAALSALTLCTATIGVTAVPASADGDYSFIYQKYENWGGEFGAAHALYWVISDSSSEPVCAGAYDVPSGAWAGTTVCGSGYAFHDYCSCSWRNGWGGGGLGGTYVWMDSTEYWVGS